MHMQRRCRIDLHAEVHYLKKEKPTHGNAGNLFKERRRSMLRRIKQ